MLQLMCRLWLLPATQAAASHAGICGQCRQLHAGLKTTSLGAYFPDLASNMLGSFFMGLAAAASTLKIKDSSKVSGCLPTRCGQVLETAMQG